MPLRLFCWHPPSGGVECKAVACRKGPSRPFYKSAFITPYICFLDGIACHFSRPQTYERPKERPASRLSQRSSPTLSHEPTRPAAAAGHFTPADFTHPLCAVCISLSPAARELNTLPPLSLPVTCFPHVCQITAGFVKPAGIALFRHHLFSSHSHLSP